VNVKRVPAEVAQRLEESRVIGIARLPHARVVIAAVTLAVKGGLRAVEVPYTVPEAGPAISAIRSQVPPDVVVGAGTIRTLPQLKDAVAAGAEFLVAPSLNPSLIAAARSADVLLVPGVYTPSEVDHALSLGSTLLKLYPAGPAGPAYMAALLQPFPEARFVPTGGVDHENAPAFLRSGAAALGVGAAIFPPQRIASEGPRVVEPLTEAMMAIAGAVERVPTS
jgi:2-dehydro-3-deoxyphosphogluconate aldolase/(4S)-4-hydroxy-2-oxoglutarate aldolase